MNVTNYKPTGKQIVFKPRNLFYKEYKIIRNSAVRGNTDNGCCIARLRVYIPARPDRTVHHAELWISGTGKHADTFATGKGMAQTLAITESMIKAGFSIDVNSILLLKSDQLPVEFLHSVASQLFKLERLDYLLITTE